ncbi:hypothetical protein [Staphylococcus pseudintermedius]|uniref:hypothetical protein n=1 Tax=Staphylococcus pseudintermedius TaxID=283734 RepID=UPI0019E9F92A|nr:hypothetical protein [Staphylococcus pseudintermedius]EGQ2868671.1 hypothetical protein [Staphylococcus pseudintermedius]EGQ2892142.1 hypothetical protein [Staphylococcus pseudintermedius]EGQ2955379.1 hypothetical protein [Staphylococcus pseudintermedius]EGQ3399431.1 hypothetical protein [Staphylococcus pseudintermedius]EHK3764639.1 hypothetical protein [Staphylococcus pseudintermedius]
MNFSLFSKLAIAGAVLTGLASTVTLYQDSGVNYEAKAQEENPNSQHFKKNVDDKELDFTDILSKDKITAKELSDKIAKELNGKGLDPKEYSFTLKVTTGNGGTIQGGGKVGEVPNNQAMEFNPNKDKITEFEITKN